MQFRGTAALPGRKTCENLSIFACKPMGVLDILKCIQYCYSYKVYTELIQFEMRRRTMTEGMRIGRKTAVAAMAALALAGMLALAACSGESEETGGTSMDGSASSGSMSGNAGSGSMDGSAAGSSMDGAAGSASSGAYRKITADEAQDMMDGQNVTIVDVRTAQEYADGHVPGAINIPVESIGGEKPSELGDVDAELIVYCRTGVRSKQASDRLIDLGYQHVNDMGGIVDWTGDTVAGDQPN